MMADSLPLAGARVLIPRGGDIGDRLAAAVSARGGEPLTAPVIEFREPADQLAFSRECDRLAGGSYDWVAVTSATAVEALKRHDVSVPAGTRVAAVGPATRDALQAEGFAVDFMPATEFSAAAMVTEWPGAEGSVLLPQSAIAEPTLAEGLAARGLAVTTVSAYETHPLTWSESIRRQLVDGEFSAVLLTSASIARAIADQGIRIPSATVVACIGESTAAGARHAGLPVHAVAQQSTAAALVDELCTYLTDRLTDRPQPRTIPKDRR